MTTTNKDFKVKHGLDVASGGTFGGPVTVGTPTGPNHAATKDYVDAISLITGPTGPAAEFVVNATAPSSPQEGQIWFDPTTAAEYVYYDGYWVEVSGPQGLQGPTGPTGPQGDTGPTGPGVELASTDDLTEGTSNLYFTDQRAVDAALAAATPYDSNETLVKRDLDGAIQAHWLSAVAGLNGPILSIYDGNTRGALYNDGTDLLLDSSAALYLRSGQSGGIDFISHGNIVLSTDFGSGSSYLNGPQAVNKIASHGHIDSLIGDNTVDGTTGNTVTDRINSAAATAAASIVDSAPETLNTLAELAAAINDDASYAATITTALGNKQDKVSGVSDTEIGYLDGVTSSIQTQLGTKVSLTGAETLTNKTLTSPKINGAAVEGIAQFGSAFAGYAFYASTNGAVQYLVNPSTSNGAVNLTWTAGSTLNSYMSNGDSMTLVLMVTNGATPYYPNVIQVDGSAPTTTRWSGGTAPTSGNANAVDVYTFTISKLSGSGMNVLASQTKFA